MPTEHPFDPELIRATSAKFASPYLSFEIAKTDGPPVPSRLNSNPAEAVRRRLARLGIPAGWPDSELPFTVAERPIPVGLERIIGKSMLMEIRYLEAGERAAKSVGRIAIGGRSGRAVGFGTGFLVGPGLLLTNNHVLGSVAEAAGSTVEFDYQSGVDRRSLPSRVAELDPTLFFATDKSLDFTLVGVSEPSDRPLESFGYLPLIAIEDEILAGECVSIIQHPNGEPKQVALRENEVLELPAPGEPFLRYKTDTLPGSSGSPVFNDQWEVIALHHSGWPSTDADGNYLTPEGAIWRKQMGEHRIHWKGNEGVRVAAIVEHLRKLNLEPEPKRRLAGAFESRPLGPIVEPLASAISAVPVVAIGHDVTITIPVQITVRVGGVSGGAAAPASGQSEPGELRQ